MPEDTKRLHISRQGVIRAREFKWLRKDLGKIGIRRSVVDYLMRKGIKSLDDLQEPEVEEIIAKFKEPDRSALQRLPTVAKLNTISSSLEACSALAAAGLSSIREVSRMGSNELANVLKDVVPENEIPILYQRFRAAEHVLANEIVDNRARYSSGQLSHTSQAIKNEEFPNCECPNCLSAVSPLAYLADLLDYALEVLRRNGNRLTIGVLGNMLKQPLSDLPAECDQLNQTEIYPRLAVEVLLKHFSVNLDTISNDDLKKAEGEYRLRTYIELLTQIGTSYEEIREARLLDRNKTEDMEKLLRLTERIGIDLYLKNPVDGSNEDLIEVLFKTPDQVTRPWLEATFGLVDINLLKRNPLRYGPAMVSGYGYEQLRHWDLNGVRWGWNTDLHGQIYVSISRRDSKRIVTLYRDPSREKCVASGEICSNAGNVELVPSEDSGLSGSVHLSYQHPSHQIVLQVIPRILVWRLLHLRSIWMKQDWPDDQLAGNRTLIDPDIIGPDDFRTPVAKIRPSYPDKAFDFWIRRRKWVDSLIKEFTDIKKEDGTPDLAAMFARMYQPFIFYGIEVVAWADTTQPTDFELLRAKLDRREDVEETKLRIKTDLNLTVESFTRLMEIFTKDKLSSDSRNEKVEEEEWQDVYSILTQARKEKMFTTEELSHGVSVPPDQFWISLREPEDGNWPPMDLGQLPLIDPDVLDFDDLPDPTAGKHAIDIWQNRRNRLDQIYKDLSSAREVSGKEFDDLLTLALGDPDPGDPLPNNIDVDELYSNLKNEIDVEKTKNRIISDLYMTVEDFKRLMSIKAKTDDHDPAKKPTATEWGEVYEILTQAQKKKREYPNWIHEESDPTTGVTYWSALKAKFPRWRASREVRQDWQQKVEFRSQPPLIDIDIIDEYDLRLPNQGAAADLLIERQNIRRTCVDSLRDSLNDALTERAVEEFITQTIGVDREEFQNLSLQRASGKNITHRVQQLGLELGWFDRLVRLKDIELIEDEKSEIIEILWQTYKRRQFGTWRWQEREAGVTLGPDYF